MSDKVLYLHSIIISNVKCLCLLNMQAMCNMDENKTLECEHLWGTPISAGTKSYTREVCICSTM